MSDRRAKSTQGFQEFDQFVAFNTSVGGDDQDFLALQLATHGL